MQENVDNNKSHNFCKNMQQDDVLMDLGSHYMT